MPMHHSSCSNSGLLQAFLLHAGIIIVGTMSEYLLQFTIILHRLLYSACLQHAQQNTILNQNLHCQSYFICSFQILQQHLLFTHYFSSNDGILDLPSQCSAVVLFSRYAACQFYCQRSGATTYFFTSLRAYDEQAFAKKWKLEILNS